MKKTGKKQRQIDKIADMYRNREKNYSAAIKRASVSIIFFARDSSASKRRIGAMTETDILLAAILLPAVLVLNYNDGISMESISREKKRTIITFDPLLSTDT